MSYISQISKGIDFIEENLFRDFNLHEVTTAAGMSHWHFQRIFVALTGETLKGYVRARRLSSAMKALLQTEKRIIEIAVEAGYESQESFTRAFQNYFNMTPGEFRKTQKHHLFVEKIRLNEEYLKHISKNISMEPNIIHMPSRWFVGMHTAFYGLESEKNNMAEKLRELWQKFLPPMDGIPHRIEGVGYGLIQQREDRSGQLDYFSAVEVSKVTDLPENMTSVFIPEQCYARFLHRGDVKNINHTVNYIYSSWMLNSNYQHSYGIDIEEYGEKYHPTSRDSEVFYLIPINEFS